MTAGGFYEIGEIRRRRGDFQAAEDAFNKAIELGNDAQPGLALLRLGQGKVEAALSGIRRSLSDAHDPFAKARRLPAQVEIAVAAGDRKPPGRRRRSSSRSPTRTGSMDGGLPVLSAEAELAEEPSGLQPTRWMTQSRRCAGRRASGTRWGPPVRDRSRPDAARHRLSSSRRRGRCDRTTRGSARDLRAARRNARRRAREGTSRQARDAANLHVHRHRELNRAHAGPRSGEVEEGAHKA